MTITGKVIEKKIKKTKNIVKVNLFIKDFLGSVYCFQVRPKNIIKLVEVDTGCIVNIDYTNELNELERINNLVLNDIEIITNE